MIIPRKWFLIVLANVLKAHEKPPREIWEFPKSQVNYGTLLKLLKVISSKHKRSQTFKDFLKTVNTSDKMSWLFRTILNCVFTNPKNVRL